MKLLSCNAGYLLDYDGALREYVTRPHRALVGSDPAEQRAFDRLVEVVLDEEPDLISLVEVDQGSIRTRTGGQVEHLATQLAEHGLEYTPHAASKYGDGGLMASAPMLKHLSNGVLVRDNAETTVHYLDAGPKRLVIEVELPGVSVFNTHLAMSGRTRRSQLAELATLVTERECAIVCGDFNAYNGFSEIREAFDRTNLELYDPGATVPPRPMDMLVTETRTLDMFLVPTELSVGRCGVLDIPVSDHRPIVLEFDPPEMPKAGDT